MAGVFDGVAGKPFGQAAAQAAATGVAEATARARSPSDILRRLNAVVAATGGATTATVVALHVDGTVVGASAGDSAALVLDGSGEPDSIAPLDCVGHFLTGYLGEQRVRPNEFQTMLGPDSSLLLCSDGVHGHAGRDALVRALGARDPQHGLGHMFRVLAARGMPDDATALLVRSRPSRGAEDEERLPNPDDIACLDRRFHG